MGQPDGGNWVVLATPTATEPAQRPLPMRRIVMPIAAAALVVAGIVGLAGSLVSQRIAEQQAVHDVAQLTDVLADSVVQPALTDQLPGNPAEARQLLDPIVRDRLLSDSLVRVKLWSPSGTVLYSDQAELVGQRFALEPEAQAALTAPRTEAGISDLRRPENRLERSEGKLLEVYRPIWTPSGQPLLFETYFRYGTVSARSHQLWRGFGGIMLSSLAALLLLLMPLVWALFGRARRARAHREQLMRRALTASEEERRRIAATLHDGVVQQLAAASFTASAHTERAAARGDHELAASLDTVAGTVRDSIAGLRSLLVDIYPPSLHTSGLEVALRDLARTTAGSAATVLTDIDADTADELPISSQEAAFRIAQEGLRNAVRHAAAGQVTLRLEPVDERYALLEIADDGAGFDLSAARCAGSEGHFGLQLMADAAQRSGSRLALCSTPGSGTLIRMEIPRR
jgi:two-component system, NarL family, sensor kinase